MANNNDILTKSEEEILEERRRTFISARNIALAGILGTAIAMLSAKCTQKKQEPEAIPQNSYSNIYEAPEGYILGAGGKCYKTEYAIATYPLKIVTSEGVRYVAPEGYILGDDGKCYKIEIHEENTCSHYYHCIFADGKFNIRPTGAKDVCLR